MDLDYHSNMEEITKPCIICQVDQPLSQFYKHPGMGDGHLNKCKTYTKSQAKKRHFKKVEDPEWVESEKVRAREKYHRLYTGGVHKPTPERKKEIMQKYMAKFPEKRQAAWFIRSRLKAQKGFNLHHWSYNEEHFLDVIELSILEHNKLHRYMDYNQETKMYRTKEGVLLDTKEKHLDYYNSLKEKL